MTAVHIAEVGIEPVARRPALLHRYDLDLLTALKRVVERHHRAIHACAAAAVTQAGVHRVGEIDRCGASRQIHDLALWRQHVDGFGEQTRLELLQPFTSIGHCILPVEHLPQPCNLFVETRIAAPGRGALLVAPVRGYTVL